MEEVELDEFKIVKEEILENGDTLFTYETSERNIDFLKQIYGDDYEKKFNEDFIEYLKELIAKKGMI